MKKQLTLLTLGLATSLIADPYGYGSSCPNGNCSFNDYYQRNEQYPSRHQPYYQDQYQTRNYEKNNQGYNNEPNNNNQGYNTRQGYDNRQNYNNRQGYDNQQNYNTNQRYYNNRQDQGYYDNRSSNMDNDQKILSDQELTQKLHDTLSAGWLSKGYPNVSYEVLNGRVVLKGTVESEDDRNKIEDNIRKINGVRQVNNQIRVVGPTAYESRIADNVTKARDAEKKYPQDSASTEPDRILNGKIRDQLSGWFTSQYDNLVISTNNGVVTITGMVDNDDELKKINDKLKKVNGIKSINNQVTTRGTEY